MRRFKRRLGKHAFDGVLLVLSFVCLALMFVASSDQLLPSLGGTSIAWFFTQFPTGNQIVFDLSVGVITSVLMYVLVVRVPEHAKRRRMRRNLTRTYCSVKQACIAVFLGSLQSSYSPVLVEELLERERFLAYFKERNVSGRRRWDDVANNMDEFRIRALVVELEILMQEIHFVLVATDVTDDQAFDFFRHLSQVLYRSKNWTAEYDDVKSLLGFMWSIHTGWSHATGYPEKDIVADMIATI